MTGVQVIFEIRCAEGNYPIQASLTYWGKLVIPPDPFSALGAAWGMMIPEECRRQLNRFTEQFASGAPLMLERVLLQQNALNDHPQVAQCWQELLNHLATVHQDAAQVLQSPESEIATQWAIAVAGTESQIADLVERLPLSEWEWANRLWLLWRALSGDRKVWKFLWDELPALRDTLQESASLVALAMGVADSGSDRAWDTLAPLLSHSDPTVRSAAYNAVAQLRETHALPEARLALQQEQETTVKEQIIVALGAIGEESDANALIQYGFEHPYYRVAVRNALAQMAGNALTAIGNALQDLYDDTMRETLIDALGQMGIPEIVPLLERVARQERKAAIRRRAVQTLLEHGFAEAIPVLIDALGDESEQIRNSALAGLVERGEAALEPLLDSLESPYWLPERRYLAQWAAARAVARIGGEIARQRLMELAQSYDLNLRWAALTALRYADYPDLGEWMAQQLVHSPAMIQHECGMYLCRYPTESAIPAIFEELRNPAPAVQEILEEAVAANGVRAIPALQTGFDRWQAFPQRQAMARILQRIGHPAGRSLLERLAEDPDQRIAAAALDALKHIAEGVPQ